MRKFWGTDKVLGSRLGGILGKQDPKFSCGVKWVLLSSVGGGGY